MRKDFLGVWSAVHRDNAGRGLAGNLILQNGLTLRVIGVYGPTGASLPGFDSLRNRVTAEASLVSWVRTQLALCSEKGWYPVVLGDVSTRFVCLPLIVGVPPILSVPPVLLVPLHRMVG